MFHLLKLKLQELLLLTEFDQKHISYKNKNHIKVFDPKIFDSILNRRITTKEIVIFLNIV